MQGFSRMLLALVLSFLTASHFAFAQEAQEAPASDSIADTFDKPLKIKVPPPVRPEAGGKPAAEEEAATEMAEVEAEDEEKEEQPAPSSFDAPNRLRFCIYGGVDAPVTGEDVGGAMGGDVGYDFWDKLGAELWLAQAWSGTELSGSKVDLTVLHVKPGARYRVWGDEFRVYVATHMGLSQTKWKPPGDETGSFTYEEGFGADAGAGLEYRISNLLLFDLMTQYWGVFNSVPQDEEGNLGSSQGLFVGLGVGVSSEL